MTIPIAGVQCGDCKHVKTGGPPPRCAAFPDEIPDEILLGQHDHTQPYPGDRGIRYEPRAGIENDAAQEGSTGAA